MFKRILVCSLCFLTLAACSIAAPSAARPQLVIDEHLLSGPPDISTDQLVYHFASGDQNAILAKTAPYKDFLSQWKQYNGRALQPFGYQLKYKPQSSGGLSWETVDIYKGDQVIASDAVSVHPLSVNASGTQFIGLVDMPDGSYTFTPDHFAPRAAPFEKQPYGYAGDKLLSVEVTSVSTGHSKVNVYLDDQPAYSSEFNDVSVYGPLDGPWTYGDHWALVVIDAKSDGQQGWVPFTRLIQDGQDLTAAKGYQQAFQFSVLDGKPFYFYQKADKIGLSFDGQELAKDYDEVPHYSCCSDALRNPGNSMNMVWFFARRGNDWYYVEAYIPGN